MEHIYCFWILKAVRTLIKIYSCFCLFRKLTFNAEGNYGSTIIQCASQLIAINT